MNENGTYFKATNGWEFRVSPEGHMQYKFEDNTDSEWSHLGKQLGLGFIEWAQSEIWTGDES